MRAATFPQTGRPPQGYPTNGGNGMQGNGLMGVGTAVPPSLLQSSAGQYMTPSNGVSAFGFMGQQPAAQVQQVQGGQIPGYGRIQQQSQMPFQYMSAGTQQQQQQQVSSLGPALNVNGMMSSIPEVCNVWNRNLEDQMSILRDLVNRYKYISVDCKFPGIVARPIGSFKSTSEYHYQTLRSNVDIIEVLQIGLTFSDEFGNHPVGTSTWQFNFQFNINQDMGSSDGIELLRQSGVDFMRHEVDGIDVFKFGELLISSGLVLDESVTWITFHSGYDLGYLLSIMLNKQVPVQEKDFLGQLSIYFPSVWDVKYLTKAYKLSTKNNLHEIAEEFQVRVGNIPTINGLNQAGSDSLLADGCFFEIRRMLGEVNLHKVKGLLFGLGEDMEPSDTNGNNNGHGEVGSNNPPSTNNAANVFQFGKMGGGV